MSNIDAEDAQIQQEVDQVKQWWTDSRWRFTKRPFTAEQIVAKRGNLTISYPSNAQSKKLWNIVEGRFKVWTWSAHGRAPLTRERSEQGC
jgi:isocitrate lyase